MAVCCSVEVSRCFQLISESLKIQVASITDFYPLGPNERYESPGIIRLLQIEKAVDLQIQYTSRQAITKTCILLLKKWYRRLGQRQKEAWKPGRLYQRAEGKRRTKGIPKQNMLQDTLFLASTGTSKLLGKFYQVFSRIEKGQDLYYYIDLEYNFFDFF